MSCECYDIFLGNAATATGARHVSDVDTELPSQTAHARICSDSAYRSSFRRHERLPINDGGTGLPFGLRV
jgi:hypothetical protein